MIKAAEKADGEQRGERTRARRRVSRRVGRVFGGVRTDGRRSPSWYQLIPRSCRLTVCLTVSRHRTLPSRRSSAIFDTAPPLSGVDVVDADPSPSRPSSLFAAAARKAPLLGGHPVSVRISRSSRGWHAVRLRDFLQASLVRGVRLLSLQKMRRHRLALVAHATLRELEPRGFRRGVLLHADSPAVQQTKIDQSATLQTDATRPSR